MLAHVESLGSRYIGHLRDEHAANGVIDRICGWVVAEAEHWFLTYNRHTEKRKTETEYRRSIKHLGIRYLLQKVFSLENSL